VNKFETYTPKIGILLVNLGSPKSPTKKDIRNYLDEFLMDEYVIDIRWLFRSLLVQGIILNTRPKKSSKAYQKIWSPDGSPLIVISKQVQEKLTRIVDFPVSLGMRYSEPSIETGIQELVDKGINEIILFPLYPQYSTSTTKTVIEKAEEIKHKKYPFLNIKYVNPFYKHDLYIKTLSENIKNNLPKYFDKIIFSYHGVPNRHIFKADSTKTCNLDNCRTDREVHYNKQCYLNHCYQTTLLIQEKLSLPKEKVMVTFQSRLGKSAWVQPYTDATLKHLPSQGIKNIAIVCPAFVSDCLETLEEISILGKKNFRQAGGENFTYIPCLNNDDEWINTMKKLIYETL